METEAALDEIRGRTPSTSTRMRSPVSKHWPRPHPFRLRGSSSDTSSLVHVAPCDPGGAPAIRLALVRRVRRLVDSNPHC
eukprot:1554705-Pyramimonas_sp.AAC.1